MDSERAWKSRVRDGFTFWACPECGVDCLYEELVVNDDKYGCVMCGTESYLSRIYIRSMIHTRNRRVI